MHAYKKLARLESSFVRRARRLQALIHTADIAAHGWSDRFLLAICIIELQNAWFNFSRTYYLSYVRDAYLRSGVKISCSAALDYNQAIGVIANRFKPHASPKSDGTWRRRDEPAWHDPNVLLTGCQLIGASNYADVQAAMSSGSRVFIDLPVFRNFYAHRNGRSEAAAKQLAPQYGVPSTLTPDQILLYRQLQEPQALVDGWVDDLVFTVQYLCH